MNTKSKGVPRFDNTINNELLKKGSTHIVVDPFYINKKLIYYPFILSQ
jgi:hypothetical protein